MRNKIIGIGKYSRKIILLPLTLLLVGLAAGGFGQAAPPSVKAASAVYALVTAPDAYLFRENALGESIDSRYFLLPKTYFVQILEENAAEGVHKVKYKDLEGFVQASKVEIKDYTPKSIFPPKVTLKIVTNVSPSVYVRETADHERDDNIIDTLPKDTAGVEYYNVTQGSAANGTSNAWYYINFKFASDSYIKGYVYRDNVSIESEFPAENDTTAYIPPIEEVPGVNFTSENTAPDTLIQVIIIVAICIPALLILYFIFKPASKKAPKESVNHLPESK